MDRSELHELHYITPIDNVISILDHGILCHKKAKKIKHKSISDKNIQDRRTDKKVPGGLFLHEYVNLYLNARNPMLYKRRNYYKEICVLMISSNVLDLQNVIIADGNAASDYTAFYPVLDGLKKLDKGLVFAEWWTDDDEIQKMKKKELNARNSLCQIRLTQNILLVFMLLVMNQKKSVKQ